MWQAIRRAVGHSVDSQGNGGGAPETSEGRTLLIPAPGLRLRTHHYSSDAFGPTAAGKTEQVLEEHLSRTLRRTSDTDPLSLLQALYPLSLINGSRDEAKGASAISRNLAAHQGYTVVAGNNHNAKGFSSSFILLVRTIFTRREAHLLHFQRVVSSDIAIFPKFITHLIVVFAITVIVLHTCDYCNPFRCMPINIHALIFPSVYQPWLRPRISTAPPTLSETGNVNRGEQLKLLPQHHH